MRPVLFEIPLFGTVSIHSYSVLVTVGFLTGICWVVFETRRLRFDTGQALNLVFYIVIVAVLGSGQLGEGTVHGQPDPGDSCATRRRSHWRRGRMASGGLGS